MQRDGEEETDAAIGEVKGESLEGENRCAVMGVDEGVQVGGDAEPDERHGRSEQEGEHNTPVEGVKGNPAEPREDDGADGREAPCHTPCRDHPARPRGDEETDSRHRGAEEAEEDFGDSNQPEVGAAEGKEEAHGALQHKPGADHEQCNGVAEQPTSSRKNKGKGSCKRGGMMALSIFKRVGKAPCRLSEIHSEEKHPNSAEQGQDNRESER